MKEISENLKEKCGVYIIINIYNGKRYIGSSNDIKERLQRHFKCLRDGVHVNKHLQNAYNLYGESFFEWGVLKLSETEDQYKDEQYFIDVFNPEYNIEVDVINHSISNETKEKISEVLKEKYNSGFTNARYLNPLYIYDINNWELLEENITLSKACLFIYDNSSGLKKEQIDKSVIKKRYVILSKKYDNIIDLKNFVSEHILTCKTQDGRKLYLIVEYDNKLHYFKTAKSACDFMKCSSPSTLKKHQHNTQENPYIIPNTDFKVYYSKEFIPITK